MTHFFERPRTNRKTFSIYSYLLRVFYSQSANVKQPGIQLKYRFTKGELIKGIIALTLTYLLFGFPDSVRKGPFLLAILYTLSLAGVIFMFYIIIGSLLFHLRRWTLTLMLHRTVPKKVFSVMRMAYLHRKYSTETSLKVMFLIALPLFAVYWWSRTPVALIAGILAIYNCIIARALRIYLPPSALILTTSASDTVDFHMQITFYLNAFRTVQLLKGDLSSKEFQYISKRDCFRTKNEEVWKKIVDSFIEICPIIILDVRQITTPVLMEAQKIFETDISYKLIFLAGAMGQRPLLDELGSNSLNIYKHKVPILREAGVITLLDNVFLRFRRLPTEDYSLSEMICASDSWITIKRDDWISIPEIKISRKS